MVKPTFKVDGMHFEEWQQAFLVANRLYERYDKTRSIMIYMIDHHGEESVDFTFAAESTLDDEQVEEQLELF